MSLLPSAAVVLLPIGYLVTTVLYGRSYLAEPTRRATATRPASATLRGLLLVHAVALIAAASDGHGLPVVTVAQALSVLALAVAGVYAFVEWQGKDSSTGVWLIGLAFLFQFLASLLARPGDSTREFPASPLLAVHVSLALIAYAAFAVASAYGALFLLLYRELKASRFTLFFGRLPPLAALDRMMAGAMLLGLAALTGAVVVGSLWARRLHGPAWSRDATFWVTLATWGLYVAALLLRRLRRWQGRQTAIASLVGLSVILVSLVAINALLTNFHAFR